MLQRRKYRCLQRAEISPGERLALTLRYLATDNSQISLSYNFRIAPTVCSILQETCTAIWDVLYMEYVKTPSTVDDWRGISLQFGQIWNFPNCIGAIDGKHIVMQVSPRSDSMYFNYKGSHSIVLLAICDAQYRFILVDIGNAGQHGDGGVLSNSSFGQAIESGSLSIPPPSVLPGMTTEAPFVFVGMRLFHFKPTC